MPRQILQTLSVPALGGGVSTSFTTDTNKFYLIKLSGTVFFANDPFFDYITDGIWLNYPAGWSTHPDLRFQINGADVPDMPFSTQHIYWFVYQGTGNTFSFNLRDIYLSDNSGSFEIQISLYDPTHDGSGFCPIAYVGNDQTTTGNPISLHKGEKREEVTDLTLNSPAAPLAFTRYYRQSKQTDAQYQFMGLGWTHSHNFSLSLISGTPNSMVARMPNGGEAYFTETGSGSNQYEADPGSNSSIIWNPGTSQYTLTAPDQSTYTFDSNGKLTSRSWPMNQAWTYTYASSKLSEVSDGYGRKLVFRYYTSGDPNGQLFRVGDQTFNDTDPMNPTGRYVEFSYVLNKVVNGSAIDDGTDSLLSSVRDVRGNIWSYDYYGQASNETDVRQLNFLNAYLSPTVDTTGDGVVDGALTLDSLTYTMQGTDLAVNGTMETDSDWSDIAGAAPTINQRSTTQVDTGTYSRRVVASAASEGIEGIAWNLLVDKTYIVTARVYPVTGAVKMQVTNETAFDRTSSGTGSWQTLRAVYKATAAATGRKLQFIAEGGAAEFYVDTVSIIQSDLSVSAINQQRGNAVLITEFAFQAAGQNITTETVAGKTVTHHFESSIYLGAEDHAGNYSSQTPDGLYRPRQQSDPNGNITNLQWSADGKRLNEVTDALGKKTTLTYNSNDTLKDATNVEGRKTEYTYGDSNHPRLPTRIKTFDTNGTTVVRWQEFTYNSGRTLTEKLLDPTNGSTVLQQITRAYGTSGNGNGLLETLTEVDPITPANNRSTTYTYDSAGRVIKTQQSSLFGTCQFTYTVYDDAGNVLATVCSRQNVTAPTSVGAAIAMYDSSDPDKSRVTTYEYDPLGRRIKTTVDAGATYAQTTLTVYDAMDRVIRTIGNYKTVGSITHPYSATHGAFNAHHGTDNNENLVTDTAYNARGLVKSQTDVLGNVTLYGYDDADRLIKTIQNASQPSYNNDYSGMSPDPTLNSYVAGSNADQDLISTQAYDKNGNLVKAVNPLGMVTFTAYDALNRPVKTVRSAKDGARVDLNPGDTGYNAANDPRSASYSISTNPDRDLIDETEYDALGRVIRTKHLLENRPTQVWEYTLFGYDPLGRQVKVIRNASNPTYNIANDQDLSSYSASANVDQDIVNKTTYDHVGRVIETEDSLGVKTRFVYDGLGRQVKSIANYIVQGSSDPKNWVWDAGQTRWEDGAGNAISFGTNADQNIITETVYDSDSRVQSTRDVLGRMQYNVYDTRGRTIRTVTNYIAQGTTNPKDWVWSATNNRWERSVSITTAIDHGTDNDQNIIVSTVYDAQGRVSQTIDHRNNVTLQVYDVLGRRLKSITNYIVQGSSDAKNWLWDSADNRWEDGAGNAISFGTNKDQNRITATSYDIAGRVTQTRDAGGIETRVIYDAASRRLKSIANYITQGATDPANWLWDSADNRWEDGAGNAIDLGTTKDQNLISTTSYNKGSQVASTRDARGTETAFTYDVAGRRLTIVHAANSPLARTDYTCYDKAGRVLRAIQNWSNDPNQPSPDAKTGTAWDFVPQHNGQYHDRDLITLYDYDLASRTIKVTDPLGNFTSTGYFKDGQVKSVTDPEGMVTEYRYDKLSRRTRVIQSFVSQSEDPSLWVWDAGQTRWETSTNAAIAHGTNNDQNIIVLVVYDTAGRIISQRDPRGNLTTYVYDRLNRRKSLTNPLSKVWSTARSDLGSIGGTRTTMTYPGVNGGSSYTVQRDFDRLGRPMSIAYGDPANTPDVKFVYDNAGNRSKMTEYSASGFTSPIRETNFNYDDVRRLSSVGFDNNGDTTVDETVNYEYDAGGLRTKLTLPGSLNVTYIYDQRGQLISLTDWDSQKSEFAYDQAGRHNATIRPNGMHTRYHHDAAGRLKLLRHTTGKKALAHFAYEVDKRGNRIQALEVLAHPETTNDTTIAYNDKGLALSGTWSEVSGFKESAQFAASLKLIFLGDAATLTMGTGPDHGIYDVYVGGSLWQSFDGYAATAGQRDILISAGVDSLKLQHDGPHLLEIRSRAQKNPASTGFKTRFKQLVVADKTWASHTIEYSYDALSRLLEARYNPNINTVALDADLLRRYQYTHDRAGNRTQQIVTIAGSATTTNYTYNNGNQLTGDGTYTYAFDNNGNLRTKKQGSTTLETSTWDRANRLLSLDTSSSDWAFEYDGLGNRRRETLIPPPPPPGIPAENAIKRYILDLQPPLTQVLAIVPESITFGGHYVYGPRGIHAQENSSHTWDWVMQDGLGSVRGQANEDGAIDGSLMYAPYGEDFDEQGSISMPHGFTGEMTFGDLLHLRARDYSPALGVFPSLDPFEGMMQRPMSLNGYSYVEGNPSNWTDPTGMQCFGEGCTTPPISNPIDDIPVGSPNSGVYDFDYPQQLADWCNNGFCSNDINILLSLTSIQERQFLRHLRRQCDQGDIISCRELIRRLGIKCREQRNFEACRELLALCNNGYNDDMEDALNACKARRVCTKERARELHDLQVAACDRGGSFLVEIGLTGRGCSANCSEDCTTLARKIAQNLLCVFRRQQIIDECFSHIADDTHSDENGALAKALRDLGWCQACFYAKCTRNDERTFLNRLIREAERLAGRTSGGEFLAV